MHGFKPRVLGSRLNLACNDDVDYRQMQWGQCNECQSMEKNKQHNVWPAWRVRNPRASRPTIGECLLEKNVMMLAIGRGSPTSGIESANGASGGIRSFYQRKALKVLTGYLKPWLL